MYSYSFYNSRILIITIIHNFLKSQRIHNPQPGSTIFTVSTGSSSVPWRMDQCCLYYIYKTAPAKLTAGVRDYFQENRDYPFTSLFINTKRPHLVTGTGVWSGFPGFTLLYEIASILSPQLTCGMSPGTGAASLQQPAAPPVPADPCGRQVANSPQPDLQMLILQRKTTSAYRWTLLICISDGFALRTDTDPSTLP